MRITSCFAAAAVVVAVAVLPACGSSDGSAGSAPSGGGDRSSSTTSQPGGDPGGELLVINAEGGRLAGSALELTGADADLTVFADRPARSAGRDALSDLPDDWEELGFAADPPNAALVARGEDGPSTTVVELGRPTVDGGTVSFPVTPVPGGGEGALSLIGSDLAAGELKTPSLFIDAGSANTVVPVQIDGTWGAGDSRIVFDWWDFSQSGGTYMNFSMGEPGTIEFLGADSFMSMTTTDAITGTFTGVGVFSNTGSFYGQASVPAGSDLTIGICGAGGPTSPLATGPYSLDLPSSC